MRGRIWIDCEVNQVLHRIASYLGKLNQPHLHKQHKIFAIPKTVIQPQIAHSQSVYRILEQSVRKKQTPRENIGFHWHKNQTFADWKENRNPYEYWKHLLDC
ncbi:MAG: hypothetical protein B7Z60_07075 [Ferrovum sp. 37-45-19]|nr:MAG: hypothetical protein B7Z65_07110 [Ferrovum sp. 21-44-67]OYV93844.1 MAG: hypothetical protein B7Z60_07075 [Ferrovum sp. 37-45-19]OZB32144.1 MAG: hypothetical protein B7X47_07230 [Ferrovum sp. 34-44-207]